MFRMFLLTAAALSAAWFAFFVLSDVDMGDVVAYNDIDKHVGSVPFRAGDVVGVSPDGNRFSYVCSMDVESGELSEAPLSKTYVNGLGETLPQFAKLVTWVRGMLGQEGATPDIGGDVVELKFEGRISAFPAGGAMPEMSHSCACAVAASLIQRYQVCTVERSLIESKLAASDRGGAAVVRERTVGVTFRPFNILIPDIAALGCPNIPTTANLENTQQTGSCSNGATREYDVALRHVLGVIREEDLQPGL